MELKFQKIEKVKAENSAISTSVQNLLTHLPGEATALYIIGLDSFGKEATALTLVIIALVALAVMFLIRYLANATKAVYWTSFVAFVLWVYAIGNGPFQALGLELPQGVGAFLIAAFTTIITLLANAGKIK
jgi:hypothetical protein